MGMIIPNDGRAGRSRGLCQWVSSLVGAFRRAGVVEFSVAPFVDQPRVFRIVFNGFGIGDSTSTAFWDVLATLYGNPQSTTAGNLIVRRAGN